MGVAAVVMCSETSSQRDKLERVVQQHSGEALASLPARADGGSRDSIALDRKY